jgi:hypothetical protein
MQTVG